MDFVKVVCDKRGFYSQGVDIFEPEPGKYLMNELQWVFGAHHPRQMMVDGKPGCYLLTDSIWVFHEGLLNTGQV